jgi:hypothetical protein
MARSRIEEWWDGEVENLVLHLPPRGVEEVRLLRC